MKHQITYDYIKALEDFNKNRVPIYKGCLNEQCFCTGECKKIIGYRDKNPSEK